MTVKLSDSCKVILLDIEGTTTSISFVKETLFPYIRDCLVDYIESHWDDQELRDDIERLREQSRKDVLNNVPTVAIPVEADVKETKNALIRNILLQMDSDRKTTSLKQLQGHMWREGYKNGKLRGHIYDDVLPAFKHWHGNQYKLCIYSSGSVEAQKLLFGYSDKGDLLLFISDHFDTNIGAKVETESYKNIAKKLRCNPEEITFFTDIPKEAEAAKQSGMDAILVVRPGNNSLTTTDKENFPVINSFEQIIF